MNNKAKFFINTLNGWLGLAGASALPGLIVRDRRVREECDPKAGAQAPCNIVLGEFHSYFSLSLGAIDVIRQLLIYSPRIIRNRRQRRILKRIYENCQDILGMAGSVLWFSLFCYVEYEILSGRGSSAPHITISDEALNRILAASLSFATLSNPGARKVWRYYWSVNVEQGDAYATTKVTDFLFGLARGFMRGCNFARCIDAILNIALHTDYYIYSNTQTIVRLSLGGAWGLYAGCIDSYFFPDAPPTELIRLTDIGPEGKSWWELVLTFGDALFNNFFFAFLLINNIIDQPSPHNYCLMSGYILLTTIIPILYGCCPFDNPELANTHHGAGPLLENSPSTQSETSPAIQSPSLSKSRYHLFHSPPLKGDNEKDNKSAISLHP